MVSNLIYCWLSFFVVVVWLLFNLLNSWYHGKITKQDAYGLLMTGTIPLCLSLGKSYESFVTSSCIIFVRNKLWTSKSIHQSCTADRALKPLSFSLAPELLSPLVLIVGQVCSFLVRPSDKTPGDYSLFFRTNEKIQRFKISPTPNNQYMMGGRYYNRYAPPSAVVKPEYYE